MSAHVWPMYDENDQLLALIDETADGGYLVEINSHFIWLRPGKEPYLPNEEEIESLALKNGIGLEARPDEG